MTAIYKWYKDLGPDEKSTKFNLTKFGGITGVDEIIDGYNVSFNCSISTRIIPDEPAP